jgi:hypothetical protein
MAVTDTLSIIRPATLRHEKIYLACVTATYPRYLVSSTRLSLRLGAVYQQLRLRHYNKKISPEPNFAIILRRNKPSGGVASLTSASPRVRSSQISGNLLAVSRA